MKFNKLYLYFNIDNLQKIKILYGVSDDYSVLNFVDEIAEYDNLCGYSIENKPLTKEEFDLILTGKITYCNCIERVKKDYIRNYNFSLDY